MPGLGDDTREIMRFVAESVSRDTFVNIMEQYRPDAHVRKPRRGPRRKGGGDVEGGREEESARDVRYAEINRAVTAVRKAAEAVGLWRFCDPPRHDSFAI
ncbi:hypothetical protein F5X97DRAFT_329399 [Nemania serpens]|nr:hypothetical protein F5X97DRAFT_329399 [Nemania serpens]